MRLGPMAAVLLLVCNGCVGFIDSPKTVDAQSVDLERARRMVRTVEAPPLRVESVVYKPAVWPVKDLAARLARGDFRGALHRPGALRVHDAALDELMRRGYVPVLVNLTNTGRETLDARTVKLVLEDEDDILEPIQSAELPLQLTSFRPAAVPVDAYNMAVGVVTGAAVLGAVIALEYAGVQAAETAPFPGAPRDIGRLSHGEAIVNAPSVPVSGWLDALNLDVSRDNDMLTPLTKTTSIDYNNLLYRPSALAPGENCRGLLFFKTNKKDWSRLQLYASLN